MKNHIKMPAVAIALVLLAVALPSPVWADRVHIAAASNFSVPLKELVADFEADSGHEVVVSAGSTGKLYAQIRNGAPFDVFLAADVARPELLENRDDAVPGSRFTYARGRLVLWSPRPGLVDDNASILATDNFHHLAIANPKLAPYGEAAQETLEKLGHWEALQGRLIRGENVSQTLHFVVSGNADLGLVALAQVKEGGRMEQGSAWAVPQSMHRPIDQQAVLLKDSPAARAFLEFLRGDAAREIIVRYGYDLPDAPAQTPQPEAKP